MENLEDRLVDKILDIYDNLKKEYRKIYRRYKADYSIGILLEKKLIRFRCSQKDPFAIRIADDLVRILDEKLELKFRTEFVYSSRQYRFNPDTNKALNIFGRKGLDGSKVFRRVQTLLKDGGWEIPEVYYIAVVLILSNRVMNGAWTSFDPKRIKRSTINRWNYEIKNLETK